MTDTSLSRMADHVLAHGLRDATLRPLARAAGTSDRMLIYRHGSKEALIAAILDHLAQRLTGMLDAAPLPRGGTADTLADGLLTMMRSPDAQPYVAVWLEVVAGAARGDATCRATGARIIAHFHRWLADRLPPGTDATAVLARIEGTLMIDALGGIG
jgi:AcrR family transcriptional regulator